MQRLGDPDAAVRWHALREIQMFEPTALTSQVTTSTKGATRVRFVFYANGVSSVLR